MKIENLIKLDTIVKMPVYKSGDGITLNGGGVPHCIRYYHVSRVEVSKSKLVTFWGKMLKKKGIFKFPQKAGDKRVRSFYVNKNDVVNDCEELFPWYFIEKPEEFFEDELIYEEY